MNTQKRLKTTFLGVSDDCIFDFFTRNWKIFDTVRYLSIYNADYLLSLNCTYNYIPNSFVR